MFRHKKTGYYWFRRAVPKRFQSIIGKTEITKSLGTKNYEDAKRANRRVADEVDALFEQAKAKLTAPAAASAIEFTPTPGRLEWDDPSFTTTDAERLAQQWLTTFVARDKAIRDAEDVRLGTTLSAIPPKPTLHRPDMFHGTLVTVDKNSRGFAGSDNVEDAFILGIRVTARARSLFTAEPDAIDGMSPLVKKPVFFTATEGTVISCARLDGAKGAKG